MDMHVYKSCYDASSYQRDSTSRSKQRAGSEGVLERPDRRRGSSSYKDHEITDEDTQVSIYTPLSCALKYHKSVCVYEHHVFTVRMKI